MNYNTIDRCRVCDSPRLEKILYLGDQPLANALKDFVDTEEDRYPLTLAICEQCFLIQILETVVKELLFKRYFWVTGTSSTARLFAQRFYDNIRQLKNLEKNDLVVEIASNDGTFLRPFVENGHRVLGVDPAENIVEIARGNGIRSICEFWNLKSAQKIRAEHGKAAVVFARNVIPHVSDLHSVMDGIHACMADDGIGAIEFHYVGNILDDLQYDAIYHEHLCYFSIQSVNYLLDRHGLKLFHIDLSPISGGAHVVYFSKNDRRPSAAYEELVRIENEKQVNSTEVWKEFGHRCEAHREWSKHLTDSFYGQTIVGYGASARSSTYLNFCGFNQNQMASIIDNNPIKNHKFTPGSSIQIVSTEKGMAMKPDLIFLLAWNFKDEIIAGCRELGYRGPFLVPFPKKPYTTDVARR